ncbi:fungal-specific transcription factor domain-containing protein [Crepidotus variabilis]|uniref:Fungal-specific transcription factor domain-containing protein n=1 Tax=Crepidotus variabilis TaxID=179855 RepID=A0A9P6EQ61_9AGAR|nr:fungal-specific transcription factor domain-containing protein [Crepidotus variabilis]
MQKDHSQTLPLPSSTSSTSIQNIDPALALYPPYFPNQISRQQQHQLPQQQRLQHLTGFPEGYQSSAADAIGALNMDQLHGQSPSSNSNGKRPSSTTPGDSRKKARTDDEEHTPGTDKGEGADAPKAKSTRGSRACTVCRRLKMKCVGGENGPPCKRCQNGNHECVFEESNRGKRSTKKHEILSQSLKKMERTLDTVLRSIGNPALAANLATSSRSPSPSADGAGPSHLSHPQRPMSPMSGRAFLSGSPSPEPDMTPSTSSQRHSHQHHNQAPQEPPGSPKLHSLPDNTLNPLGLLAEASLANRRAQVQQQGAGGGAVVDALLQENSSVGVASRNYFKPGPMTILPLRRLYIERQIQPEMLTFVTTEEVVALFNIYFEKMHIHADLLDPAFHTPSLICSRSPFLLTTICSIASKFYTPNPDLHPKLTELAKKLSFSVPAQGYKSVEIVQAYLLLVMWGCGAVERYEQDKTWMLLGMGIRMATDLNLHKKTMPSAQDAADTKNRGFEVHNRERTWFMCYVLDRSFSSQLGKPSTIKEDYIIRHTKEFYSAPAANEFDIALCGYVEIQQIMSRCLEFVYSGTDTPSGLQQQCDYMQVMRAFETQLQSWWAAWVTPKPWQTKYLRMIAEFYYQYSTLVVNSFGLQNAMERKPVNIPYFFAKVHSAAHRCAILVRDHLAPSGHLRYSPDSHFVQISYAVLSLLKLIRPEFRPFLDKEREIINLVKDVADVLENIAANPSHTPALYSGFLRALIAAKIDPPTKQEQDMKPPQNNGGGDQNFNGRNGNGNVKSHSRPPSVNGNHNSQYNTSPSHTHRTPQQQNQMTGTPSSSPAFASDSLPLLSDYQFHFTGEMGPVQDMTTFPPTMAPPSNPPEDSMGSALTMENILGNQFWDSMVVPGYNSIDGFSGGFVFGAGGSGLITPHYLESPMHSGLNTPNLGGGVRGYGGGAGVAAFD